MPRGVYDRATAKPVDRRAVALAAITDEVRLKMSASASARRYLFVPCAGRDCDRTVTNRSQSMLCSRCAKREWKRMNPDKVNAANRRYNAAKPEVMRASRKRYEQSDPERIRTMKADVQATRRARKQACFVEKVYRTKVLRLHEGLCGVCGDPVDPSCFHVDHIVPLALGGAHSYANTQPAHPACNLRKAAKAAA